MAVKTKPRYRGTPYAKVKWNPVCEMPEFEQYLNSKPENKQESRSTYPNPLYYGKPKPWWKFW